jgi:hypothetical protein
MVNYRPQSVSKRLRCSKSNECVLKVKKNQSKFEMVWSRWYAANTSWAKVHRHQDACCTCVPAQDVGCRCCPNK